MAMLSKQDHSRSRVTGYKVDENLNLRLDEKTKGQRVENTGLEG
jgi:hypothetical protein